MNYLKRRLKVRLGLRKLTLFLWQLVLRIWSLLLLMATISSVELVDIYGEINAKMVEIPANDAATSTSTSIYLRNGNQKPLLVKSFCI